MVLLLVILGLAIMAGILSASETAITAASHIKLHHLKKQGSARAELVLKLQSHMGQMIASILLANTWVITCMTALTTGTLTLLFGPLGAFYAAAFLSAFITIYLEVMPKIVVFAHAEQAAMVLAPGLSVLRRILSPMTTVVEHVARYSLHLCGLRLQKEPVTSTLDELRGAIDLHVAGQAAVQERLMLRNILDLTRVPVSEVMIHRNNMTMIDLALPSEHIVAQVMKSPFTRIPVWRDNPDNVVGLLHSKALFRAMKHIALIQDIDFSTLLSAPWFIPETTTLLGQLQAFRERRAHFAFVVDEYGALLGMVTLEDILEEIVGDIVDEHDADIPGVKILENGHYHIRGTVTVRDLNRQYDWSLPDDKATTLAGLLLEILGTIPEEGQVFRCHGLEVKIAKRHQNQIQILDVRRLGSLA